MLLTLEIVKFFQAIIISNEKLLRTPIRDIDGQETGKYINCSVQSSGLNEELGQVKYILSDKTGTLTVNKMEFNHLIIGENIYENSYYNSEGELILDNDLAAILEENTDTGEKAKLTLRCLALCHDAEFDHTQALNSSSPEEIAFLVFCENYGFKYRQPEINKSGTTLIVNELDNEMRYQFLEKFDFSGDRRRMSVVVKDKNQVYIFTKGADEVLREFLFDKTTEELERVDQNINLAAQKGLRTMMLTYKVIELSEWENFYENYKEAKLSNNAKNEITSLQSYMEKGSKLLGAVALEDKLQDKVCESIKFIKEADIKFWIITGDKTETAISVARSAGIVDNDMEIIKYTDFNDIGEEKFIQLDRRIKALPEGRNACSVISGQFLLDLQSLKKENLLLYKEFIDLMMRSEVAVFSRISPRQKQEIVKMIREYDNTLVTLAIGDGANDVNMITAANVGVGIKGLEGRHAARASDYNFGEFQHIIPLMFYFGRESYRKNSTLILYNFYKNILIVMPQFWFGFFNFFSGQTLYEQIVYQNYNIFFTFLPIFLFGIFDKTHKKAKFLYAPLLYKTGHNNVYFNFWRFLINVLVTMVISLYICLTSLAFFDWGAYENGYSYGFWNFGNMVYFAVVVIVNAKILSISSSYSVLLLIFIVISIGLFFFLWLLLNFWKGNELYNTFYEILNGRHFYLYFVVVIGICVFEYLYAKLDYHFNIVKYEAEYEVNFDIKRLSQVDEYESVKQQSKRASNIFPNHIKKKQPNDYRPLDNREDFDGSFYTETSNVSK